MRVLLTGQVGLGKAEYLERVQALGHRAGFLLSFATVGQKMIELYDGTITDQTILNLPQLQGDMLRRDAWADIREEARLKGEDEIFVVNSHAYFRWPTGSFPAIDLDLTVDFRPHVVATLIDDVHEVKRGMQERGTPYFELWELLAWREVEIWLTRFLANWLRRMSPDGRGPAFYVLPKGQGPELLFRLLTERETKRAYLSFPITAVGGGGDPDVEKFKELMGRRFIAFDPYGITEGSIVRLAESLGSEMEEALAGARRTVERIGAQRSDEPWQVSWDEHCALCLSKLQVGDITLSGREVSSVKETIQSQIISRDFLLIDQSDMVVTYIAASKSGAPRVSAGSQAEMVYAYAHGKPVYVVFAGDMEQLSPWVTRFSQVFPDSESLVKALSRRV